MFDAGFDQSVFQDAIADVVPGYQRASLQRLLDLDSDVSEYEKLGRALVGEGINVSAIVHTRNLSGPCDKSKTPIWDCIKAEVYDLFCTQSARYKAERKDGEVTVKNLITIVATAVAGSFSLPLGIVVGAVTLCLMAALKIGKNGYCEANKP